MKMGVKTKSITYYEAILFDSKIANEILLGILDDEQELKKELSEKNEFEKK